MKRPKPRDYGLDSDHAPLSSSGIVFSADPAQPFTQEELDYALDSLIRERATAYRRGRYGQALDEWNYNNGGR